MKPSGKRRIGHNASKGSSLLSDIIRGPPMSVVRFDRAQFGAGVLLYTIGEYIIAYDGDARRIANIVGCPLREEKSTEYIILPLAWVQANRRRLASLLGVAMVTINWKE